MPVCDFIFYCVMSIHFPDEPIRRKRIICIKKQNGGSKPPPNREHSIIRFFALLGRCGHRPLQIGIWVDTSSASFLGTFSSRRRHTKQSAFAEFLGQPHGLSLPCCRWFLLFLRNAVDSVHYCFFIYYQIILFENLKI